ncbi:hypothetical protein Syun_017397 [Stephania yunnanensis]|uniref:Ubiquitin thioesterase OTU n=1 Tax=Stephania yunnanensis TaxID=152371 RepID=A0AAP0J7S4_9MAGN
MIALSPISTPAKQVVCLCERVRRHISGHAPFLVSQFSPKSCSSQGEFQLSYVEVTIRRRPSSSSTGSLSFQGCCLGSCSSKLNDNSSKFKIKSVDCGNVGSKWLAASSPRQNTSLRLLLSKHDRITKIKWYTGSGTRLHGVGSSAGVAFGLSICFSCSEPVYSEASREDENNVDDFDSNFANIVHGKKVYNDYAVTGIPGDGRCLFRSVVHGACLRLGEPLKDVSHQQQLADDLRARVADEFVKRREETEWFVEGDFDEYVSQIRKPHVWGGEPELFMASHVLKMPITVYMYDEKHGGLITIAEYGQEYDKHNPIRVLYHGFGHYDALQIPGKGPKSKL